MDTDLFEGELADKDLETELADTAQVARCMYIIKKIEEQIDAFATQSEEAVAFYEKKMKALEQQVDFFKDKISTYLSLRDTKTLATHLGTATIMNRTKCEWPDDKKLVEWSVLKKIPLRISESPDKAAITEYIRKSGEVPEGYLEKPMASLVIRKI